MHTIDLAIIVGYLLITLVIGLLQSRKVKCMKDYAVADRNYSTPVMVAAIAATAIGGATTIGVAEKVFATGLLFLFSYFGDAIYKLLIAKFIAPKMSQFEGLLSVGDIMGKLYGTRIKILTGIAGTLYSVGTLAAQISALGYLFYYFTGLEKIWGILVGAGAAVLYATFGGIRAVTITDVIQFAILIIVIPITCSIGLSYIGGIEALIQKLPSTHFNFSTDKILEHIGLFIIFSLPLLSPAITQRLLMAKSTKQMILTMRITAIIELPFLVVVGLIGLIAFTLNSTIESQMALPYVIATILPIGIKGLAIAGMLAVIMSSADSFLNSASVLFVHDVINPIRNKLKKEANNFPELKSAKLYTFVFGGLAIGVAMSFKSIMDIVIMARYFWGPIVIAPLILGIFRFKVVRSSIYAGMVGGFITFILWKLFASNYKINPLVPSIIVNVLVVFIWHFYKEGSFYVLDQTVDRFKFFKNFYFSLVSWLRNLTKPRVILSKLNERTNEYGAEYVLFGVFCTLNYIAPFFMWSPASSELGSSILVFRLIGSFLCFVLIIKDYLPEKFKEFLPFYWYIALTFCLPFFTTYMLLSNNFSLFWMFNSILSLFILVLLVDALSFFIILIIGMLFSSLTYTIFYGKINYPQDFETSFLGIYMFIFSVTIGVIFSRRRERLQYERQRTLKAMGGSIAHEMRTPLARVMMSGSTLKKKIEKMRQLLRQSLIESEKNSSISEAEKNEVKYKIEKRSISFESPPSSRKTEENWTESEDKRSKLVPEPSTSSLQQALEDEIVSLEATSERLKRTAKDSQNLINLLLSNLRQDFSDIPHTPLSIKACLVHVMEEFAFNADDREKVHITFERGFQFEGNLELITHIFFNLLKNSLYFIKAHGKGEVFIEVLTTPGAGIILFKDTGPGIEPRKLSHLFEAFYSQRPHGTGIGLSFCKKAIESMGGEIKVESVLGEHTTFTLTLPKINEASDSIKEETNY